MTRHVGRVGFEPNISPGKNRVHPHLPPTLRAPHARLQRARHRSSSVIFFVVRERRSPYAERTSGVVARAVSRNAPIEIRDLDSRSRVTKSHVVVAYGRRLARNVEGRPVFPGRPFRTADALVTSRAWKTSPGIL